MGRGAQEDLLLGIDGTSDGEVFMQVDAHEA